MSKVKTIWILGSSNPNADMSIPWESRSYPNFSDPDELLIDLTTLKEDTFEHIDKSQLEIARQTIVDRFLNGGNTIFITAEYFLLEDRSPQTQERYYNYYLSPFSLKTEKVPKGSVISPSENYIFDSYIKNVKSFSFYLHCFEVSFYLKTIFEAKNEHARKILQVIKSKHAVTRIVSDPTSSVVDHSNHDIATALRIITDSGDTGFVVYLPPTTKIPVAESIGDILSKYGKDRNLEVLPEWTATIDIPGLKDAQNEINELLDEKNKLEESIQTAKLQEQNLLNHYRLLTSKGTALEDATYDAFKILGLPEINRGRGIEFEDGIFEIKNFPDFKYAVIEIFGTEIRSNLGKLRQCKQWIDDYFESGSDVKGIYICNQNRLKPYPESMTERIRIEERENKYAKNQNICIIPSCVLFESVKKALDKGTPTRKGLEECILNSRGVINEL